MTLRLLYSQFVIAFYILAAVLYDLTVLFYVKEILNGDQYHLQRF